MQATKPSEGVHSEAVCPNACRRSALTALACLGAGGLLVLPGRARAASPAPSAATGAALAQWGLTETGRGDLRFFGLKIYEAKLWAPSTARLGQLLEGPFALELHYSRRFDGADIARRSIEEIEGLGLISPAQRSPRLAELRALFPNVEPGDRLLGLYQPQGASPFFFNGHPIGEIRDPRFAQQFFRIWLDPKTSEPRLRQALLGRLAEP